MRGVRRLADARAAAGKVANVAGVLDVRADASTLATLEEAVGENQRLHDRLEVVVSELEQALVPLLEKALAAQESEHEPGEAP